MLPFLLALACSSPGPTPSNPVSPAGADAPRQAPDSPAAIAAFWTWFAANEVAYRDPAKLDEKGIGCVNDETVKVHRGLLAEFTTDPDGTHVIVLSADGIREVFPSVQATAAAAPAIPGWRVQAFRPPVTETDWSLQIDGKQLALKDFRARWAPGSPPVNVDVWVPLPADSGEQVIAQVGFLALDAVLGEYAVETQVGAITWHGGEAPAEARPLGELRGS